MEDLHDVTLFGNGKPDHAAVLIKGKMDRGHLEKNITQSNDYERCVLTLRSAVIHPTVNNDIAIGPDAPKGAN
ncbi:MAG: hypothetical protein QNL80_00500 [Akkermansiaceae bacterium]